MKPDIAHYFGRPVERVHENKAHNWAWKIELEGNVLLVNEDKRRTATPEVDGLALVGYSDDNLIFTGGTEVAITSDKFSIEAPGSTPDEIPTAEETRPDDPSVDRVVEGREETG